MGRKLSVMVSGPVTRDAENRLWKRIVSTLNRQGFTALIAGGAVRDMLLGRIPSDVDIVTDASPDDLQEIFPPSRLRRVGTTFPLFLVDGVEISSCRSPGHFPEADLSCRDFTINSMALDPTTGNVIDPHGGRKDLQEKRIRFTLNPVRRILEDPLRMIRAARLASQLGGRVDAACVDAIGTFAHLIRERVAGERIRLEILKAMEHERPSVFFRGLEDSGCLRYVFPSLDRLRCLDGGPFHGETVFEHCLLVGDALPGRQPLLRLAGFLHDAGKYDAVRLKNGAITFPGHETFRSAVTDDLESLRFSRREKDYINAVISVHMRPLTPETTPKAVRRLLAVVTDNDLSWQEFMRMRIADKGGNLKKPSYTFGDIRKRVEKLTRELNGDGPSAFSIRDLNASGHDVMAILGCSRGPEVGAALRYLFERVLEEPGLNRHEHLARLLRERTDSLGGQKVG